MSGNSHPMLFPWKDRNGKQDIAERHHHQAVDDGAFIVLRAVGYESADEAQHIDSGIKKRINQTSCLIAKPELRAKEQREDSIHDIIPETLAHIGKGGGYQSFRMVFKHRKTVFIGL